MNDGIRLGIAFAVTGAIAYAAGIVVGSLKNSQYRREIGDLTQVIKNNQTIIRYYVDKEEKLNKGTSEGL